MMFQKKPLFTSSSKCSDPCQSTWKIEQNKQKHQAGFYLNLREILGLKEKKKVGGPVTPGWWTTTWCTSTNH